MGADGKVNAPVNLTNDDPQNPTYGAKTVDINWNPSKAGVETDGTVESPAMVLLHEAIHGDHDITDLKLEQSTSLTKA